MIILDYLGEPKVITRVLIRESQGVGGSEMLETEVRLMQGRGHQIGMQTDGL